MSTDAWIDSPARVTLFNNIASFVYEQLDGTEPALKRRRVDIGPTNGFSASASNVATQGPDAGNSTAEKVLLEIKEISVSIPQRKKFDLCFTENYLYARAPGTAGPVQGIVYAWKVIGKGALLCRGLGTMLIACRICLLPPGSRKVPSPAQLHPLSTRKLPHIKR